MVLKKCPKFIARDLKTRKRTCCILFNSGKVAVGDDVWRLSNSSDLCEYPYKTFKNSIAFEKFYEMEEPPKTRFEKGVSNNYELSRHYTR